MRYVQILLLIALFVATCSIAADKPSPAELRIQQLVAVQQKIIVEMNVAQEQIAKLQQVIETKKMELYKLQGAIEEIQRQEAEAAAKVKQAKENQKEDQ